ncbi:helix-hairpin-helix domain-containing protein [Cytobacillus sp. FJAT-54145]|uniref:Helix-hairpin-helix domain-containing protein n=1 Tax=Cytobacillus spartinae TaxID=3299023 RepID=A0ABW6KJ28_9BACI
MIEWIKERKLYVLTGIGTIIFGAYYFLSPLGISDKEVDGWSETEEIALEKPAEEDVASNEAPERMYVDVKGAVKAPGVYEVKEGDRVIDIIDRAGGLLELANEAVINFAMKVTDEMVLYIPTVGEEGVESQQVLTSVPLEADGGKVNLNKATESELQTIPGIGPSKAKAIVDYREQNGSFKTIEDLKSISGIGDKTFEKLKEHITVR